MMMKKMIALTAVVTLGACCTTPPGPPPGYAPPGYTPVAVAPVAHAAPVPTGPAQFNGHTITPEPALGRCAVNPPPHDSNEADAIDQVCGELLFGPGSYN